MNNAELRNWIFITASTVIISVAWGYQSYISLLVEREKTARMISWDKKQIAIEGALVAKKEGGRQEEEAR